MFARKRIKIVFIKIKRDSSCKESHRNAEKLKRTAIKTATKIALFRPSNDTLSTCNKANVEVMPTAAAYRIKVRILAFPVCARFG